MSDTRNPAAAALSWFVASLAVWGVLLYTFVYRAPSDAESCRKHLADARTALDSAVARSHSLASGLTCAEVKP
jgi:hypothetical protein